jgi:TonB family protein
MKTLALLFLAAAAATAQSNASGPQAEFRVAGAQPPAVIQKSSPEYTEQARRAGIEGTVLLRVEIGTDGRAHGIHVIRGLGFGLDTKAVESVRQWRFQPATRDGIPVPAPATIEVNFKLSEAPRAPVRL